MTPVSLLFRCTSYTIHLSRGFMNFWSEFDVFIIYSISKNGKVLLVPSSQIKSLVGLIAVEHFWKVLIFCPNWASLILSYTICLYNCNIGPKIRPRYKYVKTFIMFISIGIRKTQNTDDSLGTGTKLLLPSLSLGFSTRGERDTIFTMLTVSSDPTNARAHPAANNWTGLTQTRIPTRSVQVQISTHCLYSKSLRIPAHRFRAWRHSYPQSLFLSGVFIVTSVIVTSSPRAHEHLHSICAPN